MRILCLAIILGWVSPLRALEPRPTVDFDLVVQLLAGQGSWQEHATYRFAFHPKTAEFVPYRLGQWIYTDYGWTWKGGDAASWATDHYGYWTKKESDAWIWVPGAIWMPAAVDWVQSGDYVGWRTSKLDRFGNAVETETERHSDPAEWNFVLLEKLRGPLHPADFAGLEKARELLVSAQPADHVYVSYREIERPGPAPEVLKTDEKQKLEIPVVTDLKGADLLPEKPAPQAYYCFRPKFFQDADGILRRVDLFLHPRKKQEDQAEVQSKLAPDPKTQAQIQEAADRAAQRARREQEHNDQLYR